MDKAEAQISITEPVEERRSTTLLRANTPAAPAQILFRDEPVAQRQSTAGVVLFSIGALFAGLLFSTRYANEANRLIAHGRQMEAEAASIMENSDLQTREQAKRLMQFGLLSKKGVPVAGVMAQLVQGVSPNITFANVAINSSREVRVEGEAKSELAMTQALQRMRNGEAVHNLKLSAFRHPSPDSPELRFVMVGEAISLEETKK